MQSGRPEWVWCCARVTGSTDGGREAERRQLVAFGKMCGDTECVKGKWREI